MIDIRHMLLIDKPIDVVYKAVTEQGGLAAWWTFETIATPEIGAIIEFKFGDRYLNKMKVLTLEPNSLVEWECIEGDEQWVGTRFKFDLEKQGDQTLLRFFHTGCRDTTDFYAHCNYQWGYYMKSLKTYCETGEGTPFEYRA